MCTVRWGPSAEQSPGGHRAAQTAGPRSGTRRPRLLEIWCRWGGAWAALAVADVTTRACASMRSSVSSMTFGRKMIMEQRGWGCMWCLGWKCRAQRRPVLPERPRPSPSLPAAHVPGRPSAALNSPPCAQRRPQRAGTDPAPHHAPAPQHGSTPRAPPRSAPQGGPSAPAPRPRTAARCTCCCRRPARCRGLVPGGCVGGWVR